MSKRSEINARVHILGEIKSILGAMKSLSIIEINKVTRYLGAQNEFALTVEEAFGDYAQFFGTNRIASQQSNEIIYVLLGSERGFCGSFNETILKRFAELVSGEKRQVKIVAVGRRIGSSLQDDPRVIDILDGPSSAEAIAGCITDLVQNLARFPEMQWTLLHWNEAATYEKRVEVINPFAPIPVSQMRAESFPPLLNLPAKDLLPQLFEQYLFSVLYKAFYLSFLAENRERLRHMEGALTTLDDEWNKMRRLANTLRQEEVTEELEVIMLSANSGN